MRFRSHQEYWAGRQAHCINPWCGERPLQYQAATHEQLHGVVSVGLALRAVVMLLVLYLPEK